MGGNTVWGFLEALPEGYMFETVRREEAVWIGAVYFYPEHF
jgi:hypothetical protein